METDPNIPIPVLDEDDRAAVAALLVRAVRLGDQIAAENEAIKAAYARIGQYNLAKAKGLSALELFGFPPGPDVWDRVRKALGGKEYDRAFAKGKGKDVPKLLERMGEEGQQSETITAQVAVADKIEAVIERRQVPVRDAILRHLRAAGENGTNVGEVRRHLAEAYGMRLHEKTPGMTLYRLLKDGLARRVGRTWYATEEHNENEAPSGNAAGASEAGGAATPPKENQSVSVMDLIG